MKELLKNKFLIPMAVAVIIGTAIIAFVSNPKTHQVQEATALINGQVIYLEIADTPAKQVLGLSYRETLPESQGLLFIYEDYRQLTFWMKAMNFPIDIIWIKDDKVVGVSSDLPAQPGIPDEKLTRYPSPEPINYVLEVNAGVAEQLNISPGDRIVINLGSK